MANEALTHIKTEWHDIPGWVKIGTLVAGAGLFLLTRLNGGSSPGTVNASPGNTPSSTGIVDLTPGTSTGTGTTTTSGTPTTTQNPNNIGLPNAAYNPVAIPTSTFQAGLPTAALNPAQQNLQNTDIQKLLGPYGGSPLQTTNPTPGINSAWDSVTQTTYSGGGTVTNLGFAQQTPTPGSVIPPAVQDATIYIPGTSIPDWNATLQQAYQYPQNFSPGMTQPSGVINPVIQSTPYVPPTPPSSVNFQLQQEQATQAAIDAQTQATRAAQLATYAKYGHY